MSGMRIIEFYQNKQLGDILTTAPSRIHNADIIPTIKYFSEISGIPVRDLHKVGTTGKTPSSGDIDLVIDSNKYDIYMINTKVQSEIGNGSINKKSKVASYIVYVRGRDTNRTVRIDLMYGKNPNWGKFVYHSEGEHSKYTGTIRNILLSSVASALNKKGFDHMGFDQGQLVIHAGRQLDLPSGLTRIFRYKNKSTSGYGKKLNTISRDQFKQKFPNIQISGKDIIIDDPTEVVKILFGSTITPSHVNSTEQILQLIKKRFSQDKQDAIFKIARKQATKVADIMRLPPEIQ